MIINKIKYKLMKYEFKDIKDVDLSKLEDDKSYFIETTTGGSCCSGLVIKNYWHVRDITKIMFPCSPIVETDEGGIFNNTDQYIESLKKFLTKLPHLSVSKEVESDLEVDVEFHEDFKKDQRRKNNNHFELTHIFNSDGSIGNSYPITCNENGGQ